MKHIRVRASRISHLAALHEMERRGVLPTWPNRMEGQLQLVVAEAQQKRIREYMRARFLHDLFEDDIRASVGGGAYLPRSKN